MKILHLDDYGVAAVRRNPALRGKKVLARGTFGAIFDGSRPDTVFKLTLDGMHHAYLTDGCFGPSGPHAPLVVEDVGDVGETSKGETLYLVELERLTAMPRACAERRLVTKAMRHVLGKGEGKLPEDDAALPGLPASLAEFFAQVNNFALNFACHVDGAVGNNYMLRPGDGTLVASDPVYDRRLVMRHESGRHRLH
jgi:hypothetical protein